MLQIHQENRKKILIYEKKHHTRGNVSKPDLIIIPLLIQVKKKD